MSFYGFNGMNGLNGANNASCCPHNQRLIRHLIEFIGQTVTIFTTSGGPSGCGFTGVVLSVNCDFVRLVTQQGTPPSNPLSEAICGDLEDGDCNGIGGGIGGKLGNTVGGIGGGIGHMGRKNMQPFVVGSVCDIPIDKIAAFCHNAV